MNSLNINNTQMGIACVDQKVNARGWKAELYANQGHIYLPNGEWGLPHLPFLRIWEGDVWCNGKQEIEDPSYEQGLARFIDSVVAAGYRGSFGTARFNFVLQNLSLERAQGDLLNWEQLYIDRERVYRQLEHERTICDTFGVAGRRTMNHL